MKSCLREHARYKRERVIEFIASSADGDQGDKNSVLMVYEKVNVFKVRGTGLFGYVRREGKSGVRFCV